MLLNVPHSSSATCFQGSCCMAAAAALSPARDRGSQPPASTLQLHQCPRVLVRGGIYKFVSRFSHRLEFLQPFLSCNSWYLLGSSVAEQKSPQNLKGEEIPFPKALASKSPNRLPSPESPLPAWGHLAPLRGWALPHHCHTGTLLYGFGSFTGAGTS